MKAWSARTWESSFTLTDGRNKFLAAKVMRPWHRLPKKAVAAPSLEVFKARLVGAWRNVV